MEENYYTSSGDYVSEEAWYDYDGIQNEHGFYQSNDGGEYFDTNTEQTFYQRIPSYSHSSPISAIAIDAVSDAICVASEASLSKRHQSVDRSTSILTCHSFTNGAMYSSCVANNGPRRDILDDLYFALYGFQNNNMVLNFHKVPSHAYQPPYHQPNSAITFAPGVQKLLPFSSKSISAREEDTMDGFICSVSPNSVRLHTRGGLLSTSVNIEGMMNGSFHPNAYLTGLNEFDIATSVTHVTVGGLPTKSSPVNLHCLDLYSGSLKSVASHSVRSDSNSKLCITDIQTSFDTNNIICGCSDGSLRIFDGSWRGGNYLECAKVKSHGGGVAHVAVSGNLICTTGYSSRNQSVSKSNNFYTYPDGHIFVYDIRYLGRGGIAHPFTGNKGGPRFVSFIPEIEDGKGRRILIASGQIGGGIQMLTPFDSLTEIPSPADYFQVPMDPNGESITALSVFGGEVVVGTSFGAVHNYHLNSYPEAKDALSNSLTYSTQPGQNDLQFPSYEYQPPSYQIEPIVLEGNLPCSIFNNYIFNKDPIVSPLAVDRSINDFVYGPLSKYTFIPAPKRLLSNKLLDTLAKSTEAEFLASVPIEQLGISVSNSAHEERNFNKTLHGDWYKICYDQTDPRKRGSHSVYKTSKYQIPDRYRSKEILRGSKFCLAQVASLNDTLFPGWDYPPSMSNSYVTSVLLLIYFVPEIRDAMLSCQKFGLTRKTNKSVTSRPMLCTELGFLYHQIHMISSNAMLQQKDTCRPIVGTFSPSNFLSTFVTMPEASALALLDSSPAAVDLAKRPEAFYRFMLRHLDKEINSYGAVNSTENIIDSLKGMDSISITHSNNNSDHLSIANTRSYVLELSYDPFIENDNGKKMPEFGEILQYSLCKDSPLRAWSDKSQTYETVIQRKVRFLFSCIDQHCTNIYSNFSFYSHLLYRSLHHFL